MRDEDIHIGDILLVRQWDDMVREFGVNEDGYIETNIGFGKSARALCGKQFTVINESVDTYGKIYKGAFNGEVFPTHWFTADELEPLPDEDWNIANDEEIKLLFGV